MMTQRAVSENTANHLWTAGKMGRPGGQSGYCVLEGPVEKQLSLVTFQWVTGGSFLIKIQPKSRCSSSLLQVFDSRPQKLTQSLFPLFLSAWRYNTQPWPLRCIDDEPPSHFHSPRLFQHFAAIFPIEQKQQQQVWEESHLTLAGSETQKNDRIHFCSLFLCWSLSQETLRGVLVVLVRGQNASV